MICFENIEPLIIKYEGGHLFIIYKLVDHLFSAEMDKGFIWIF